MLSRIILCGSLAITVISTAASASVVAHETLDEMAKRVPVIIRGRVARSVSGWDEPKRRIWTWTEVVVSDPIKGAAGTIVLVKQPGGEVDGIGQAVSGTAQFQLGDDCVLFLEPAPDERGAFRVSSLAAGKVTLTTWQGHPTAMRDTRGLAFAAKAGTGVQEVRSPEVLGSPEQFIARVRAAAAAGAAQ